MKICSAPKYSLQDITIVPSEVSYISSRKECDTTVDNFLYAGSLESNRARMFPIFTSPMASIIDDENYKTFNQCGINTVIPRNIEFQKRLSLMTQTFIAVSMKEAEYIIENADDILSKNSHCVGYVCIDVANGHMNQLLGVISRMRKAYGGKVSIMSGNIANPSTYEDYCLAGCDYVRCGIGTGSQCVTTSNTSIHYPIASLVDEIIGVKKHIQETWSDDVKSKTTLPKIILDGGIKNFDDINKALGLGADYVMIGKLFAECAEACSPMYYYYPPYSVGEGVQGCQDHHLSRNGSIVIYGDKEHPYKNPVPYPSFDGVVKQGMKVLREYYGMSTTIAQLKIDSNAKLKQSEGISSEVRVKYHLKRWTELFDAYLRSCMSYCNAMNIDEFRKNARFVLNSNFTVMDYASKKGEYR